MLLNYGVGEDSWQSLGLQGDQISQSQRKSILNIHWRDWCWGWSFNTLATWCEQLTHWKDWKQEEKGMTEDEIVGWHHRLNGHEFKQILGVSEGQETLACCRPWGHRVRHDWVTDQQKQGFLWWIKWKTICLQCRRPRFNLWVGKNVQSLEKGMATHSSILAWEIPRTEESGGL